MQTYEEVLAENAALKRRVAEVESENAALRARLAEIEARLGTSSRNSSKPPSSDPPNVAARPKKKPSGRKRGGQPGHRGATRRLLPPGKVDRIVDLKPEQCDRCGRALAGHDPKPRRRQVIDVPPVEPDVTEYRQHTFPCGNCGARTTAPLPPGVTESVFSPRIKAMLAMCSAVYRLSRRTVEGLMSDFFNVDISLGSVSACEEKVSEAVARPVAEAREYVEKAPVAHADETGCRQASQADLTPPPGKAPTKPKAWPWTAVTPFVTVFLVHAKRSAAAAKELLGSFAGVLVSDRWSAYSFINAARRQLCWAHLLRDFEWIAEFGAERTGKALVEQTKLMFRWWHRLRAGGLTRSGFHERMRPLIARVEALLDEGAACDHKKTAGKCRRILGPRAALWTFVRVEGVGPTNNAAERALRPAVIWRKLSFGSASERGSRFAERIMTVAATCRQQGRSVLEYLVAASEAHALGEPAPSLLPRTADERLGAAA